MGPVAVAVRRWLPWVLLALAGLAAVGGWSLYQRHQMLTRAAALLDDVDVDVSLHGVELSRGAEGRTEWRMKADAAHYAQDTGIVAVDNPRILYYLKDDGGEIAVNATSGEVDQESGNASLWPDVDIVSGPNRARAARLDYSSAERRIVLTGDVRLERPDMTLDAPRVVLHLDTNDVDADGGVQSVLFNMTVPAAGAASAAAPAKKAAAKPAKKSVKKSTKKSAKKPAAKAATKAKGKE